MEAANRETESALADEYRQRALTSLSQAREIGLRDPALDTSLARLRFILDLGDYQSLAEGVLKREDISGTDRCDAWFLIADAHFRAGRIREAVAALHQLTALRRQHVDWVTLAECERLLGNAAAHKEALLAAVRINPRLWKVHRQLAEIFHAEGDSERAEWHERRAVP
jgi:tetratricopeptide (TPR) repeat protein